MPRVKRGTIKTKKRRNLLQEVKGYRFGRKSKKKMAYEAVNHAGNHAFAHRRRKKSDRRQEWHIAISAGLKRLETGLSYSKFIAKLNEKGITLDRKILASLAKNHEAVFQKVVDSVK